MALEAAVGSFKTGTGTSVITVSLSFDVKVLLLWTVGRTEAVGVDGLGRADAYLAFGAAISTTSERCITGNIDDGPASSNSNRRQDVTNILNTMTVATTTIDGVIGVTSMTGGFQLTPSDAYPRDTLIHYLALGGDDITDTFMGDATIPATAGTQNITDVGFQGDVVLFFSNRSPVGAGSDADGWMGSIGFATASGAGNQYVLMWGDDSASTAADAKSYHRGNEVIALPPEAVGTALSWRASFAGFTSNGFDLTWNEATTTPPGFNYLVIKGGAWNVGNLTTRNTTGTITVSGKTFTPRFGLLMSACKAESTSDTPAAHCEASIGAFSSTSARGCQSWIDVDGAADMIVSTAIRNSHVYANIDTAAAPAIEGTADIATITSDGFTLDMDDADPVASLVGYLIGGDAAVVQDTPELRGRPYGLLGQNQMHQLLAQ